MTTTSSFAELPWDDSVNVLNMLGMRTKLVEVVHASTISSVPENVSIGAVLLLAACVVPTLKQLATNNAVVSEFGVVFIEISSQN
jgi:hypothetical protein